MQKPSTVYPQEWANIRQHDFSPIYEPTLGQTPGCDFEESPKR